MYKLYFEIMYKPFSCMDKQYYLSVQADFLGISEMRQGGLRSACGVV